MAAQIKSLSPTENYEWWHNAVFGDRPSRDAIPFNVLRKYLDEMAAIRAITPGLHNVTITVTKDPVLHLLDPNALLDSNISIRVAGQKWSRNG